MSPLPFYIQKQTPDHRSRVASTNTSKYDNHISIIFNYSMSLAVISTLNTEKQVIKVVIGTVISDYIGKTKGNGSRPLHERRGI